MVLSDLPEGSAFTVRAVLLGHEIGKRLADMGFTEGATGRVVRRALFRGPLQVEIRGYGILIRRCEAAAVSVESDAQPIASPPPFGRGRGLGRGRMRGREPGGGGRGCDGAGRGMRRGKAEVRR